jgi:hypothetical protein
MTTEKRMKHTRSTFIFAGTACLLAGAVYLSGCAKLPQTTGLPGGAVLVTETPDFKAGFTAPADGTIYIYNRGDKNYLRYSGPIKKDAVLTIDPEANTVTVDGKPLEVTVPAGGNHYQVYFRSASAAAVDGM